MLAVDMQQIDCSIFEIFQGLLELHPQQCGKAAIVAIMQGLQGVAGIVDDTFLAAIDRPGFGTGRVFANCLAERQVCNAC